ncbi:T9SS type A sorting domain-containing protein [candidate division WOR-3 bacterium]|uniref:T9SS type A sorting domain-containing protein n=1 Tax=candidate division WOR-3 bacterium TaxID=2052148 RepID=A0A9D5K8S6_UNCW3|nr:T9SS type A sorting domain-containing protein [candidate division WOR-3 bacterium]MBD3364209.1 T9SS type A sorting domain-containing protein [candidate division WOR-3 bacterium]
MKIHTFLFVRGLVILLLFAPAVAIEAEPLHHSGLETWFQEGEFLSVPDYYPGDSFLSHITFTYSVANYGPGNLDSIYLYLAVPTDRAHQELLTPLEYNPAPLSTLTDEWGLDITYYQDQVSNDDSVTYTYEVAVKTTDYDYGLDPDSVGQAGDIPSEIADEYTVDGSKYDIANPVIADAADMAVGEETDYYQIVRKLHDFVIDTLHYVLDGKWDDAPQVLLQGHGSCSEYTMLMIALCRAKGIPARYVGGTYLKQWYPYRDEVFHRWTEIYFPNYGWVSVDCTWDDGSSDSYRYFGAISKRLFVTTVSGGPSQYLGWSYNYNWSYTYSGERPDYDREKYFDWDWYGSVISGGKPIADKMFEVFPNPARDYFTVQASVATSSQIDISIYDASGRIIDVIFQGMKAPGEYTFNCPLRTIPSGVYFCRFQSAGQTSCRKVVVK